MCAHALSLSIQNPKPYVEAASESASRILTISWNMDAPMCRDVFYPVLDAGLRATRSNNSFSLQLFVPRPYGSFRLIFQCHPNVL